MHLRLFLVICLALSACSSAVSTDSGWTLSVDLCAVPVCDAVATEDELDDVLSELDELSPVAVQQFTSDEVVAVMSDLIPVPEGQSSAIGTRVSVQLDRPASSADLDGLFELPGVVDVVTHDDAARATDLLSSLDEFAGASAWRLMCPTCNGDVTIFLCDGKVCPAITGDAQVGLDRDLRGDPDLESVRLVTAAEAYERFLELFAGNEELIATVDPDSLPPSFEIRVRPDIDLQEVMNRYAGADGVEDVVSPSDIDPATVRENLIFATIPWLVRTATIMPRPDAS